MKQLFWKEWRELRLLPLGAALTVAVGLSAEKAYTHWNHEGFSAPIATTLLAGVWVLFSVLAGAGLFSQEIGTGTLQFLSSLPVPRRTLWWVKVTTALGALLLSMPVSAAMWAVLCFVWSRHELTTMLGLVSPTYAPGAVVQEWPGLLQGIGGILVFMLVSLAITMAVSPFCDRSLIASVTGILASVAVYSIIAGITSLWSYNGLLPLPLIGLTIPTFALISYWTFTRGESLRSARRFVVAAQVSGACLAVWVAVIGIGRLFQFWY